MQLTLELTQGRKLSTKNQDVDGVTEPPNLQEINYEKLPPKQLL